mmetsp:Transcript_9831/g.20434  ORF Transcript_9831/g.20434 Transcript_9831/m.20434 type:complete len:93 (-) Transcript_9831:99-377(-)
MKNAMSQKRPIASSQHQNQHQPRQFVSTNLTLPTKQLLPFYAARQSSSVVPSSEPWLQRAFITTKFSTTKRVGNDKGYTTNLEQRSESIHKR